MSIMGTNQLWSFITTIVLMCAIEFNKISGKMYKYSNSEYTDMICRTIFCIGGTFLSCIVVELFKIIRNWVL
jgi:hypothetical protein